MSKGNFDTDHKSLLAATKDTFIFFCLLLDAWAVERSLEHMLHKLSCLLPLGMKKCSLYICIGTKLQNVLSFHIST